MRLGRIQEPVGILDIGSNSIRLCVYDSTQRVPVPLFNEKAVCALAQGLGASGRLNPDGIEPALAAVGRFVTLGRAMGLKRIDILATAAVRDATDGAEFAQRIEREFRVTVRVLSGGEEARLAAMGVLCGTPDAQGIVCDMGGGSLELITVKGGQVGHHVTLPLGLLRLTEASGDDRTVAAEIVDRHLRQIPWLEEGRNASLYAVGGAWRALARICISQTQHPLTVLDNFGLDVREAQRIIGLVATQSRKSLEKVPGVAKKRAPGLALAATVLEQVMRRVDPAFVAFSIYGMREGQFYTRLPDRLRTEDPLLSVCRQLARHALRFPEHGDELTTWTGRLFPDEAPHETRIRHAACLVSDAFWNEHPDYRAEQAFLRMLRLPFMGVPHVDRAAIAFTIFIRYQGDEEAELVKKTTALLDDEAIARCRIIGQALRLAHTLSGGAPNLLRQTRLVVEDKDLVLDVPAGNPALAVEPDRGFDRLAKSLGCDCMTVRRRG
jgi:exopolyphosphatase/guanosine-5'-triphosphate,3'-diphosphate pyrophosphatase